MHERLGTAFGRYLDLVRVECGWAKERSNGPAPQSGVPDERSLLRLAVERAEGQPELGELVALAGANDKFRRHFLTSEELVRERIVTYFRRSGLYQRIFWEGAVTTREEEELFCSSLLRKRCLVTYMAPIDFLR